MGQTKGETKQSKGNGCNWRMEQGEGKGKNGKEFVRENLRARWRSLTCEALGGVIREKLGIWAKNRGGK